MNELIGLMAKAIKADETYKRTQDPEIQDLRLEELFDVLSEVKTLLNKYVK